MEHQIDKPVEKRLFCLVLLCFILLPAFLTGQIPGTYPRFTRISQEQGLSQINVNCILQDRKGLMWIGTWNGLNRYDGYEFKVYKNNPQDSTTLSDNHVYCIFEDRSGVLWIGTKYGLNRFHQENVQFTIFRPKNPENLSHNAVWCIHEDGNGILWIGTSGGLNRFDPLTRQFESYIPAQKLKTGFFTVRAIREDRSRMLWIGTTRNGLYRFDPDKRQFTTHYIREAGNPNSLINNNIKCIYEDRGGESGSEPRAG